MSFLSAVESARSVAIFDSNRSAVRVNGTRMLADLDKLATYGVDSEGGLSRLGFTSAEDSARAFLRDAAARAGLGSTVDQAGNLFLHHGKTLPDDPVVLMGSHVDTVRRGGRFDGTYGVVAGLEVLRTLAEHDLPMRNAPVAVAFSNEEGALFPYPFWGSLAVSGQLDAPEAAVDRTGRSIREPLARAGGDLDAIGDAVWPPGMMAAYLELHIEQGPVLESRGIPIGVVTGIVGRTIMEFEVRGKQNHAGTTPMDQRRDALVAAAKLVLRVEALSAERKLCAVSTVGDLAVEPGQANVVPGRARLTAEIRDLDATRLEVVEALLREETTRSAREAGVDVTCVTTMRSAPVRTATALQTAIEEAAADLALPVVAMPSGAGHDAQMIAAVAPVGMIFVPSRDGISHAPEEHTAPGQLVAGANVLLHAALRA
ncbi:M20 family metallo-hydrolase [Amycolatopsis sp. NBC_01307]|uniref:M20 family metallo-hydrolase n=1 Tax=Amycolatopsis sp. NBC_01307 TaxID=2903561 RepID=UPI002E0DC8A9|nr:M20 family metallo-hydrolase [Amycolatopsis sp. NBC_01307]